MQQSTKRAAERRSRGGVTEETGSGVQRGKRGGGVRLTRRGRRVIVAVSVAGLALAGLTVASALRGGSPMDRPADPCATPPVLRTREGVTLQPAAMRAYRKAERIAGARIPVVQSYRSCAAQALAC